MLHHCSHIPDTYHVTYKPKTTYKRDLVHFSIGVFARFAVFLIACCLLVQVQWMLPEVQCAKCSGRSGAHNQRPMLPLPKYVLHGRYRISGCIFIILPRV